MIRKTRKLNLLLLIVISCVAIAQVVSAQEIRLYGTLGTGGSGPAAMDSILIELDPDTAWDERKNVYKVGHKQFISRSIAQSAEGNKDGNWTTVIACAVMLTK